METRRCLIFNMAHTLQCKLEHNHGGDHIFSELKYEQHLVLAEIAQACGLGSLTTYNRDDVDFREVSAAQISKALRLAYEAGRHSK